MHRGLFFERKSQTGLVTSFFGHSIFKTLKLMQKAVYGTFSSYCMKMVSSNLIIPVIYSTLFFIFGFQLTLPIFVMHAVVIPAIFHFCKPVQRKLIFLNVDWPPNTDFENPEQHDISGARNLYIKHDSKADNTFVEIGVWHILPRSSLDKVREKLWISQEDEKSALFDEELIESEKPIFLYCHGNSNSRAATHRIHLYQVLQNMDAHVIAFDYRGYGDSTNVHPTEPGVVEDALVVYDWLENIIDKAKTRPDVYVWGHSLGTGITCHLLGRFDELTRSCLKKSNLPKPKGVILEAPFNNMRDEVENYPACMFLRWLPYFGAIFLAPFTRCPDFLFTSDQHLTNAPDLPVLVMHAKDDFIVPYKLGVKLCKTVAASRKTKDAPIYLKSYEKEEKLGHKWICDDPGLTKLVRNFMNGALPEEMKVYA